jgi:hypothetical protein
MRNASIVLAMSAFVVLGSAAPTNAGWILYRLEDGHWRPNGVYADGQEAECNEAAKALAIKLKTHAGCARPSPGVTFDPDAVRDMDERTAKEKAARKAEREAARERNRSVTTTCFGGANYTRCETR